MTEVAETFIEIVEQCNILLETHLLTAQDNEEAIEIVKKIHKATQQFNAYTQSINRPTKDDFILLNKYLTIIIQGIEQLRDFIPIIAKRYLAIIEEAKEA